MYEIKARIYTFSMTNGIAIIVEPPTDLYSTCQQSLHLSTYDSIVILVHYLDRRQIKLGGQLIFDVVIWIVVFGECSQQLGPSVVREVLLVALFLPGSRATGC